MWRLWQVLDSGFPVGGFAHSAGLESALAHGAVQDVAACAELFVRQLARGALPFVNVAYAAPHEIAAIDRRYDAFLAQHVARRASRLQGRALRTACVRIFGITEPDATHLPPVFGACLRTLAIDADATRRAFVFTSARGLLSAAVRLGALGPYEAQALQERLAPVCEAVVAEASAYTLDDAAQTMPMLDVLQGAHDKLYSRLFQS